MRKILSQIVLKDVFVEMPDGAKIFVPNCVEDLVQKSIFFTRNYYECDILQALDAELPQSGVFLDVGANIGNHAIYWATRGARIVHAFEPVRSTFELLQRNVSENNLSEKIVCHNLDLGDSKGSADIAKYTSENIGGTQIVEVENGAILVDTIDNLASSLGRVDFVKIDSEGFEVKILRGASETIAQHKPIIFVEIFPKNKKGVFAFMNSHGYVLLKQFEPNNYLFGPDKRK
jgi:FkbM family methyltransferase